MSYCKFDSALATRAASREFSGENSSTARTACRWIYRAAGSRGKGIYLRSKCLCVSSCGGCTDKGIRLSSRSGTGKPSIGIINLCGPRSKSTPNSTPYAMYVSCIYLLILVQYARLAELRLCGCWLFPQRGCDARGRTAGILRARSCL